MKRERGKKNNRNWQPLVISSQLIQICQASGWMGFWSFVTLTYPREFSGRIFAALSLETGVQDLGRGEVPLGLWQRERKRKRETERGRERQKESDIINLHLSP